MVGRETAAKTIDDLSDVSADSEHRPPTAPAAVPPTGESCGIGDQTEPSNTSPGNGCSGWDSLDTPQNATLLAGFAALA